MFNPIPTRIFDRMMELEAVDSRDRADGTQQMQRLRQIPPETGRFLALMAASAPEGNFIEIGTSAGYSALWISLALRERLIKLTTFEVLPEKIELAQETFRLAEIKDQIELIHGDAREHLPNFQQIAYCFIDAEKEVYQDCYDLVIPKFVPGGWLIADNIISHQTDLQPFADQAFKDERVDSVIIPIGKGLLLSRKT